MSDESLKALRDAQEISLKNCGYYVHYVPMGPTRANIHTHGIEERWQHPELQLVMPISPEMAGGIISCLAEKIRQGQKLEAGQKFAGILNNGYLVKLIEAEEGGRKVLRIILPDKYGNLEKELSRGIFAEQYNDL